MACYVSAGHHLKDPGAVANGLQENTLTIKVRDRVVEILKSKGITVFVDKDTETLAEYLGRIKPGDASVVIEFHFDAASPTATGTSSFYADGANQLSKDFARDIALTGSKTLNIANRGAHSESDSHRGRLGLVHKPGACCLVEVGFITNTEDNRKFNENFEQLCQNYATVIAVYDDKIK
jgi:N-acetylmuramoyl-L-alanine amidase